MSRCAAPGIAVVALAAALACAEPPATPTRPAGPPAAPSTPDPGPARREVRARVVRLALRVAESYPPQYWADVTSALEDGCARFSRAALRRQGDVLFVDVFHTRPAGDDVACTMIYGEQQTAVALGSAFVSGRTYTVDANGTRETFSAQ